MEVGSYTGTTNTSWIVGTARIRNYCLTYDILHAWVGTYCFGIYLPTPILLLDLYQQPLVTHLPYLIPHLSGRQTGIFMR